MRRKLSECAASLSVAVLPVAVVAVDGMVAPGPEWHFSVCAALSAYNRVHFAGHSAAKSAAATAAAATLCAPRLPARGASLRLVGVAFFRVILLVVRAKDEGVSAFHASQVSIFISNR